MADSDNLSEKQSSWFNTLRIVIMGRNFKNTIIRTLALAIVTYLTCTYVFKPAWIRGESMYPRYKSGQFCVINLMAYNSSKPERFDIVAIRMAGDRVMMLKRCLGFPGERIRIDNGQLFINDKEIEEPYLIENIGWNYKEVTLGEGEYFVVGDNRGMPMDSHKFGPVGIYRIAGKALF